MYSQFHHTLSFSAPTFKKPLLPHLPNPLPIFTTHGKLEHLPTHRIRQGNFKLNSLPHSLDITKNKKMLSCPHPRPRFFVQSQEPNDANAAKPDAVVPYCPKITLLPQRTKRNFSLTLNINFIRREIRLGFYWKAKSGCEFTNLQL